MNELTLAPGPLSALILEAIKFIIRKAKNNPEFTFSVSFYTVSIPILSYLCLPLLALLGVEDYSLPTDWMLFGRQFVIVTLNSLIGLATYTVAINPLKEHGKKIKQEKELEEIYYG